MIVIYVLMLLAWAFVCVTVGSIWELKREEKHGGYDGTLTRD